MGLPWGSGAVQFTVADAVPAVAVTPVGASGGPAGVTWVESAGVGSRPDGVGGADREQVRGAVGEPGHRGRRHRRAPVTVTGVPAVELSPGGVGGDGVAGDRAAAVGAARSTTRWRCRCRPPR